MPIDPTVAVRQRLAEETLELSRRAGCSYRRYFPAEGPVRRDLYPRSMLFFAAGKIHAERLFMAANRVSKTVSAAFEITAHLTGDYYDWWPGRRFEGPVDWWAAGDTGETTRDIVQAEMCGPRERVRRGEWAGMIPSHLILDRTLKSGGHSDVIDTLWVKHRERVHGAPCVSTLGFKSYMQGRLGFQGVSKHGVWLDEEPPDSADDPTGGGEPSGNGDIYTECLLRTATTDGMIIATFTPLRGLTPFIDEYLASAVMCDETGTVVNAKRGIFGEQPSKGA